jgi:hypothetical protein
MQKKNPIFIKQDKIIYHFFIFFLPYPTTQNYKICLPQPLP